MNANIEASISVLKEIESKVQISSTEDINSSSEKPETLKSLEYLQDGGFVALRKRPDGDVFTLTPRGEDAYCLLASRSGKNTCEEGCAN